MNFLEAQRTQCLVVSSSGGKEEREGIKPARPPSVETLSPGWVALEAAPAPAHLILDAMALVLRVDCSRFPGGASRQKVLFLIIGSFLYSIEIYNIIELFF